MRIKPILRSSYLQEAEYAKVIRFCNQHDNDPAWSTACQVVRTILGLGLRVSEAAALQIPADIQYDGCIQVRNGKGSKARQVMTMPELVPFIQKWLQEREARPGYLFYKHDPQIPLTRDDLGYRWKKLLRHAGVKGKLSIHKGRHTYATWELATRRLDIGEVAAQLGDTVAIANEFYRHAALECINHRDEPGWEPEWKKAWREKAP